MQTNVQKTYPIDVNTKILYSYNLYTFVKQGTQNRRSIGAGGRSCWVIEYVFGRKNCRDGNRCGCEGVMYTVLAHCRRVVAVIGGGLFGLQS
jgi:hypothetical protein